MKTTKTVDERVVLGSGDAEIVLEASYPDGERPEEIHIGAESIDVRLDVLTLLRIAAAIEEQGWAPRASICADHGAYDGKANGYRCPKCEAEKSEPADAREARQMLGLEGR